MTISNSTETRYRGPEAAPAYERLTSGNLLARNTILNLMGNGIPLAVAIFVIPFLIKGLGIDRFGVLTLVWMVIGYFSLFDLGLGRALTKLVAEKLGARQEEMIPALVWTSLFLMLILGVAGTLIICLLSPWLVYGVLKIPMPLQAETLYAFYLLALSIPFVIGTAGLRGILQAQQRFGLINAVRIPMGLLTFLAPLLVLLFSNSLFAIVAVLAASRLLFLVIHLLLCLYAMPALRHGVAIKRSVVVPLLRFGGWITVSNVVGPAMVYLDRFLISALVSIAAVAYYVTPYEIVTKLWIIPGAMVGVLFPAFSTSFVQDRTRTVKLFGQGVKCVFLVLFPIALLIVALADLGLDLWLGKEFAEHSARVLQWLTMGVLINSVANIPYALVQGVGRPDLTAKLHLIELPFYLFAVWWMTRAFGIEGTAIVWLLRVIVDAVILFGVARRLLKESAFVVKRSALMLGAGLTILALSMLPMGVTLKGGFLLLNLLAFALAAWFLILAPEERMLIINRFKTARKSKCGIIYDR